jgi:DNA-binding response OmpR family regulator
VSRGAAALEALASDRVDVALIDVELPDMSGAEVVRRAREAGSRAHVIAISAHVDARVRDRCLDAGVDDLAQKPLDLAALRTRFDAIALHDEH